MTTHEQAAERTEVTPLLARLRAMREVALADRTLDLPVPGYHGELVARFGPLPEVDWRRFVKQANTDTSETVDAERDLLIKACREILVRHDDGTLGPIGSPDEPPVRFDERLGPLLGYEATTAREALLGLVGAPQAQAAVSTMAGALVTWLSGARDEATETALGE